MKWIFKRCLFAAPAIMFYSLLISIACLVPGCKQKVPVSSTYSSTDSTPPGGGGPRILQLSAYSSTDSTPPGGGGPKLLSIQTSGNIPAGSSIVLDCTTPGCKLAALSASSTDTTPGPGGVRRLILGTIPVDIPDNTNLELRIIPKGDPALRNSAMKVK
jgi:hypothetical protein